MGRNNGKINFGRLYRNCIFINNVQVLLVLMLVSSNPPVGNVLVYPNKWRYEYCSLISKIFIALSNGTSLSQMFLLRFY